MSAPTRTLHALFALAVVVSVVHYTDNYVNYADFPQPDPGSPVPGVSAAVIVPAWFVFTASGVLGLWLWHRGRVTAAAFALTGYSVSGLIGIGHFLVPGAFDMVWWRQAHVAADIACGVALFVFAVGAAWRGSRPTDRADRRVGRAS